MMREKSPVVELRTERFIGSPAGISSTVSAISTPVTGTKPNRKAVMAGWVRDPVIGMPAEAPECCAPISEGG